MFLKKEPFKYNGETVTLFELSALQRIEFISYIAEVNKSAPEDPASVSEDELNGIITTINVKVGARIVAMSLWQEKKDESLPVDLLHKQVLSEWPLEAIGLADKTVRKLSRMDNPTQADTEEPTLTVESLTPEKLTPQP